MRSVLLGCSLLLLGACATVSMVPGEASVETGIGGQKTPLQKASIEFCDGAEQKGWIKAGNGLAGLANILMHGRGDEANGASHYADQIGAATAPPADIVTQIASDAEEARLGLASVTAEAERLLADTESEASRGDVTSFERALVRAQRVSRAFADAIEIVSERTTDVADANAALSDFTADIDKARLTADELAERYASLGESSI